jgi:hypothetical protein
MTRSSLSRDGFTSVDVDTGEIRGPYRLNGRVLATGFESGDRFVIGHWDTGPIGPMIDMMWARADGTRVLLAAEDAIVDFVSSLYRFDHVAVCPLSFGQRGAARCYEASTPFGALALSLASAPFVLPIFVPRRPLWFTALVERPVAALVFPGVRTTTPSVTGPTVWYQASFVRPLRGARARLDGSSLGRMALVRPRVGFGFGEPPWLPAITRLRTTVSDPTRSLDARLSRWRQERIERPFPAVAAAEEAS